MSVDFDPERRKFELEEIFDSVIGKLPDLCHPPALRLDGEDDFFNRTKDLKLEPFRTQEVFERCVTPTLDDLRHEAVESPTGLYRKTKSHTRMGCSLTKATVESSPKARYPFANPIPECMLASGYDDLRKLILSHDIEWRMLTPIRPSSEYEEKYFEKLVKLHQYHNQSQIDMVKHQVKVGGSKNYQLDRGSQIASFKHTRHGIVLSPANQSYDRDGRERQTLSTSIGLGVRLKGRFRQRSRTSITGQMAKIDSIIPTLTFTAEDEIADHDNESRVELEERPVIGATAPAPIENDASKDTEQGSGGGTSTGGRLLTASSPYR